MTLLPAWRGAELPHPPAYNLGNALRVIGPGALLLGLSLGSGDWLLGPVVVTRHGPALLWICTASVLVQAALNAEMSTCSPQIDAKRDPLATCHSIDVR